MEHNKPVIAIMYDFDKTLCTKDMQEYTFIPNVKMEAGAFWREVTALSQRESMDGILAYMYYMLDKAREAKQPVHRRGFVEMGKDLELFPGVREWFGRINALGEALGAKVEHYIISSGLGEIIEGSEIYKEFTKVYACEFFYDENDVACWPKNAVNYTTKTQFLFRINKGILDISEEKGLNDYMEENQRRIPFRNMIYIGDGLTDVPCMKLVKVNGGHSVAVYQEGKREAARKLLMDGRVDVIAEADYRGGGRLEGLVEDMIRQKVLADHIAREGMREKGIG